jgi:hypothetical protein
VNFDYQTSTFPVFPGITRQIQRLLWNKKYRLTCVIVTSDAPGDQARLSFPSCLGQACWIDCRSVIHLSRLSFPSLWACKLHILIYCKKSHKNKWIKALPRLIDRIISFAGKIRRKNWVLSGMLDYMFLFTDPLKKKIKYISCEDISQEQQKEKKKKSL